jgi:hypothetical protein
MTAAQRPDLAAMQHAIPAPGPNPVDIQAAAQRAADRPYLEFDGVRWYLARLPDMFDLGELGEAIDAAETNPVGALAAISRALRGCLADYPGLRERFRTAAGGQDDYVRLATGLYEAATARPTEAPVGSSDGRGQTSTSSKDEPPNGTSASANGVWTPAGSTPG